MYNLLISFAWHVWRVAHKIKFAIINSDMQKIYWSSFKWKKELDKIKTQLSG